VNGEWCEEADKAKTEVIWLLLNQLMILRFQTYFNPINLLTIKANSTHHVY